MKKITLLFAILIVAGQARIQAQDKWTQKADFGGTARRGAVGFSIGSKGYLGTGSSSAGFLKDFWEYDPSNDTWTQKADVGSIGREFAVAFTCGIKAYIGTGDGRNGKLRDFWEYNPITNIWTQKADFGGTARWLAAGFSIGDKGYIGTGSDDNTTYTFTKDFWEYNPSTDTWKRKADFGGTARFHAVGIAIANKGYIGTGNTVDLFNYTDDFWEYDPALDTWKKKANIGGTARGSACGFTIGSKGYICGGIRDNNNVFTNDLWEYDPSTNAWTNRASSKATGRDVAAAFSVGNKGYIGTGRSQDVYPSKDFWEYSACVNGSTVYADTDGDGYGNIANSLFVADCIAPSGYVYDSTDCNDNDKAIHPRAKEICGNGIDENCDGIIDNGDINTLSITSSEPTSFCEGDSVTLSVLSGNAITFNGSNNIAIANAPTIPTGNSKYTIEAWIKPTLSAVNGIVGWGNWGSDNQVNALTLDGSSSIVNYWWSNDIAVSVPNLIDGNWHHIAASYNGTTRSIYTDGILRGQDNPSPPNFTSNNMTIGETNPYANQYFNGSIDEVRIWNVGRTQTEIQANMKTTIPVNSSGLVAYYKLDEGTGLLAADVTGNGNSGTLVNNPVWLVPSTSPLGGGNYTSYLWSPGGETDSSITTKTFGKYSVTVTYENGCTGTSAPIDIVKLQDSTFYADTDGDGYGNPSVNVVQCSRPKGYVRDNTDCNDINASIHPGAVEICANRIDDNCDGLVDELAQHNLGPGFVFIGSLNGHNYYKSVATYVWNEANSLAVSLGGHLATITSQAENEFIYQNAVENRSGSYEEGYWIGLNDAATEGTFVWSNGELISYINFEQGEPNDFLTGEDYVEILPWNGKWNDFAIADHPEASVLRFVLEFDTNISSIHITSPMNGAIYTAPATIILSAGACDDDGKIKKIDFYDGNTLIFTEDYPPFYRKWLHVPVGSYSITAKARDKNGNIIATSDVVKITVVPNKPPTVNITSPANGTTYTALATIPLSADAHDPDGKVKTVAFYNGSALIFTEDWPPFSRRWLHVPVGHYSITAKATDDKGKVTVSDAVNISVVPDIPPLVLITSPANGASFASPANIQLTADAKDVDGTIKTVDFYNGNTLLFTEKLLPYSRTWFDVPEGNYFITAIATDNNGKTTTSAPVAISVGAAAKSMITGNKLNSFDKPISLNVNPNPVAKTLNISVEGLQTNSRSGISILSVSGVVIKTTHSGTLNKNVQLDVSSLSAGVYYIKVVNGDKVFYKQFVKL